MVANSDPDHKQHGGGKRNKKAVVQGHSTVKMMSSPVHAVMSRYTKAFKHDVGVTVLLQEIGDW